MPLFSQFIILFLYIVTLLSDRVKVFNPIIIQRDLTPVPVKSELS